MAEIGTERMAGNGRRPAPLTLACRQWFTICWVVSDHDSHERQSDADMLSSPSYPSHSSHGMKSDATYAISRRISSEERIDPGIMRVIC